MSGNPKEVCTFEDFNINFLIRENKLGRNVILKAKEVAKEKRYSILAKFLNSLDKSEPIILITNLSNRSYYCELIKNCTDLDFQILSEKNKKGEISFKNGTVVICASTFVLKNRELFEFTSCTKVIDVGLNPNSRKLIELFEETKKITFVDLNIDREDIGLLRKVAKCMNKEQVLAINESMDERIALEAIIEAHTYNIPAVRGPLMEITIMCPPTKEQNEEISKIMSEKYKENEEMNKAQISRTFKSIKKVLDSFVASGEKSGNGKYDVLENLLDFLLKNKQKVLILASNTQYALEERLNERGFETVNIRIGQKEGINTYIAQVIDETKIIEIGINSIIFYDVLINHDSLMKDLQDSSVLIHQNIDAYRLISENTIESIMYNARKYQFGEDKSTVDQINEFLKLSKIFTEHPETSDDNIDIKGYLDSSKYEYFFPTFEDDSDKLPVQRSKAERARAFLEVYEKNVITKHIRYSSALVPTDVFKKSKERCINEESDILIFRSRTMKPHVFEMPIAAGIAGNGMFELNSQMKSIREILRNNISTYPKNPTEGQKSPTGSKAPKKEESKKKEERADKSVLEIAPFIDYSNDVQDAAIVSESKEETESEMSESDSLSDDDDKRLTGGEYEKLMKKRAEEEEERQRAEAERARVKRRVERVERDKKEKRDKHKKDGKHGKHDKHEKRGRHEKDETDKKDEKRTRRSKRRKSGEYSDSDGIKERIINDDVKKKKQKKESLFKDIVTSQEMYKIVSKKASVVPVGKVIEEKSSDEWSEKEHKMIIAALIEIGTIGPKKMREVTKLDKTVQQVESYIEAVLRYCNNEQCKNYNCRYEIPEDIKKIINKNDAFFRPMRARKVSFNLTNANDKRVFDFITKFGFCKLFEQRWFDDEKFRTRDSVMNHFNGLKKEKKRQIVIIDDPKSKAYASGSSSESSSYDVDDSEDEESAHRKNSRAVRQRLMNPLKKRYSKFNSSSSSSSDEDSIRAKVPKPYKSRAIIRIRYEAAKDTDKTVFAEQFPLPRIQRRRKIAEDDYSDDEDFDITKEYVDKEKEREDRRMFKKYVRQEHDVIPQTKNVPFKKSTITLPYRVNINLVVVDLGHVVNLPKFANQRYIYPVGFKSERLFDSVLDYKKKEWYVSEIVHDENDAPLFKVSLKSNPEISFKASAASNVWNQIMQVVEEAKRRNGEPPRVIALSGPDYFGFSNPAVRNAILSLPGADEILVTERNLTVRRQRSEYIPPAQTKVKAKTRKGSSDKLSKPKYAQKSVTQTYLQRVAPPPTPTLTFHFDSIMNEIKDRERKGSSEIQVDVDFNEESLQRVLLNSNFVY